MNRKEQANDFHLAGRNCCQSVLLCFKEYTELTEEQLLGLGAPFGFGFGAMEGSCGALAAVEILMGLREMAGYGRRERREAASAIAEDFKSRTGSIICKELKGIETGKMLCPCPVCIANAVEMLEERLGSSEQ